MRSAERRREKAGRGPAGLWLRFPDEATACPGCASPRIRLLEVMAIARDAKGRRVSFITGCEACGLLFSNPPRTREELETYYSTEGPWAASHEERTRKTAAEHHRRLRQDTPPQTTKRRSARDILLEALAQYVPVYAPPPGARVLDFGCGNGLFLDRLQDWGWETYGIEPSSSLPFLRHRRLEAPPQDGSFDLVLLHHVLEHVAEPLGLLRQLAGSLREGGVLFISVPRLDTLPLHHDRRYCLNGRTHVVCFSEACLQSLLARAQLALTARLDDRLDALTEGKPLRLRLVATRTAAPPDLPAAPLRPALKALRDDARTNGLASRVLKVLPLRLLAAMVDRARERSRPSNATR